jgi:hypothetical protein
LSSLQRERENLINKKRRYEIKMISELVKKHFKRITCWKCSGTGKIEDPPYGWLDEDDLAHQNRFIICPICGGKGYIDTTEKKGLLK